MAADGYQKTDWDRDDLEIPNLLMEEILRHLIWLIYRYLQGFYLSQVVQDFFHQQYQALQLHHFLNHLGSKPVRDGTIY